MNPTRWVVLLAAALLAGAIGYSVGRPADPSHSPGGAQPDRGRPRPARTLEQLAEPNQISELPKSVASIVERALIELEEDPFAALAALEEIDDEADQALAIMTLVGQMDGAQLGALVEGIAAAQDGDPHHEQFERLFRSPFAPVAIFERWAQLDPDAVVTFVQTPFDLGRGMGAMEMPFMLRALSLAFVAQRDPERAFGAADKLREALAKIEGAGPEAGMMVDMFIGVGMAVSDPVNSLRTMRERGSPIEIVLEADPLFEMAGPRGGEMLAEVLQFPAGEERDELLLELYGSWGHFDLQIALDSIDDLPEGSDKEKLAARAMRGALKRDPAAVAHQIGLLTEGKERDDLTRRVVERWANHEPVEALAWARQNMDEEQYVNHLRSAAAQLPVEAGRAFVEALSDESRERFFSRGGSIDSGHFAMRLIGEDPQVGLAWLKEQGGEDGVSGAAIARAVIGDGIEGAIELAGQIPEPLSAEYTRWVAAEAGRQADAAGIEWARSQGVGAHGDAVEAWASEDPLGAVTYAADQDRSLEARAVEVWAREDPEEAFRWAVGTYSADPEAMADVLAESDLITDWGSSDPVGAVGHFASLPEEIAAPYIGTVVGNWAEDEPGRASEFVAAQFTEDGAIRDQAVVSLVEKISGGNPEEALAWAESISDPEVRDQALERLQSDGGGPAPD